MADINESFPINSGDYLAFDANDMKSLVMRNLNSNGFTDTDYEGSNWSALTDHMASFFGMFMFMLNKTGGEHTFTTAQLYENMNRMVGAFNYSVGGKQTAILPFKAINKRDTSGNFILANGVYTIPRYTSFSVNGVAFSFISDVSFTVDNTEDYIVSLSDENSLYQGTFEEYPLYTAQGEEFEKILLNVADVTKAIDIDHFNIHVYVREAGNTVWRQWNRVETLYLTSSDSESFEVKLNPKQKYEIRFGDNVSGKKLSAGSAVQIYYLRSDMTSGEIGSNIIDGNSPTVYANPQFFNVVRGVNGVGFGIPYMTTVDLANIAWSNPLPSTKAYAGETVDDIRKHAPKFTRYKNFTSSYIQAFIDRNFKGLAYSTKVVSNKDFVNGHLAYMMKLNQSPSSRFLQNTINFSSCASFNNIYIYCSPNNPVVDDNGNANFILDSQKAYMLQNMSEIAVPTADFVFQDPVYMEGNFCLIDAGDIEVIQAIEETSVVIVANILNRRNPQAILTDFYNIVSSAFHYKNNSLGGTIDYTSLNYNLRNIEGVNKIFTVRTSSTGRKIFDGINLVLMSRETPKEDFVEVI